jgi:hypothetical protein
MIQREQGVQQVQRLTLTPLTQLFLLTLDNLFLA